MSFVHLHNHSHFSILEGLPKPSAYAKKAKELGMSAVAITDTGNIHGCHELYKACKSEGIQPILGTEIYVQSELDPTMNHKLVLLAKSLQGYRNIISLVSKASLDNPGKTPKIQFEDIVGLKLSSPPLTPPYEGGGNDSLPLARGESEGGLDIVCLSGPITGEIPYYVLAGKTDEEIVARISVYQELFGKENYYLELLYHDDIPKQKLVTDRLIDIHTTYHIPVVATNNCYYIHKEDKTTQDVIQALGTGHEIENPDRPTRIQGDYAFLTSDEMESLFGFLPEAIQNTEKIASMIDIHIETGGILIPVFELPEEDQKIYERAVALEENEYAEEASQIIQKLSSSEWYLRYLSFIGLNWRFEYGLQEADIFECIKKLDKPGLEKKLTDTSPQELKDLSLTYYTDKKKGFISTLTEEQQMYIDRLEYELAVIHEMGFDAYFLIVADYINWARDHDIPVGPGRGSAAGSLMAYLSGITDLNPLDYDLLFERFLNPARVSMPDIDTDFADNERDRVVDYCRQKYGSDHVAQICTFGTFAARAAVKDVGRVRGIPFGEMNELAKLIPEKPGTKLKAALEDSIEFKQAYDANKKYQQIIDDALKIEGNVRQIGVHACAVIIAPEPMTNFTGLQHPPKDDSAIVTQYSAYPLEDLGLLKMDFLGLRNLTIIKRAQRIIKNNKGIDVDILKVDLDDQKVFEVFAAGDTTGVFQFESDGMRKYLRDLKPNTFEDLIAMVSLYRPGPLAYIPAYIDRKYGREEIMYLTPDLRKILEEAGYGEEEILEEKRKLEEDLKQILDVSYGIAVYQEQLMFIVQYMAGFSLGEADLLRRGVGKKKIEVIEALKKEFIEKAEKYKGYKPETSRYIYTEMIQPAANYSFNKSHAACYAFIAYQTAYLKAYYRTEFLTSLMVSDEENMERVVLEVGECESKAVEVLPPSVNESMKHFTYISDTQIRFGLKAIKGVGDGPINKILDMRPPLNPLLTKEGKDSEQESRGGFESLEQFIELCGKEVVNKKSLEALILSGAMDDLGERGQMFASIDAMIQFSRRDERKKETNQIGLFDATDNFEDALELKDVPAMVFEEKLIGEKEMLGLYVSGHPLDGLARYCQRRSSNIKKLKMSMEELLEIDKKEHPEKYEKDSIEDTQTGSDGNESKKASQRVEEKQEIVQAVGLITDLRKIITKGGKPMVFLKCDGFDYEFEVVIFPKDVEKYEQKLQEGKIVIVNGQLSVNFEYGRKGLQARDIKIATITQVRQQAEEMSLLSSKRRLRDVALNVLIEDTTKDDPEGPLEESMSEGSGEQFESQLEEKIAINRAEVSGQVMEEEYVIEVPSHAKKEDLHDLKAFLMSEPRGYISVYIYLQGQKIDTKMKIGVLEQLENWIQEKWGPNNQARF